LFQKDLREYAPADVVRLTDSLPVTLHIFQRKHRRLHPHNALLAFRVVREIASVPGARIYFNTLEDMYLLILSRLFFSPSRIIIGVHDFIPHRKFSTLLIKFTHQLVYRLFRNFHFRNPEAGLSAEISAQKSVDDPHVCEGLWPSHHRRFPEKGSLSFSVFRTDALQQGN